MSRLIQTSRDHECTALCRPPVHITHYCRSGQRDIDWASLVETYAVNGYRVVGEPVECEPPEYRRESWAVRHPGTAIARCWAVPIVCLADVVEAM